MEQAIKRKDSGTVLHGSFLYARCELDLEKRVNASSNKKYVAYCAWRMTKSLTL